MKLSQFLIAALLCIGCISAVHAQRISELVVYIECEQEGQPKSRGTGVLVSEKGHVLTAKHVVPDGYECKGVTENSSLPTRGLIRDPRSMENIDARLLKFTPIEGEKFPSVKFCKIDDTLKGKSIKARGFSSGSDELTLREGVISTINSNDKGIIQTDVLITRGMSGGPVMLGDSSNLIGIVAGAEFDPGTAQPEYFGVLAAEVIADEFRLMVESDSCAGQNTHLSELGNSTSNHSYTARHQGMLRMELQNINQIKKLIEEPPLIDGQPVLCDSASMTLLLAHSQKDDIPVLINSISVHSEPLEPAIALGPDACVIDTLSTRPHGIAEVSRFLVTVNESEVRVKFIKHAGEAEDVKADNILWSAETIRTVTLRSGEEPVPFNVLLETKAKLPRKVWFSAKYDENGPKTLSTAPIIIWR